MRGNSVTLEQLDDNEAFVRVKPKYFEIYASAGHLKPRISLEDYRQIFETIWQDRANSAGWDLQITYDQGERLFHFEKS